MELALTTKRLVLRPYQEEALEALDEALTTRDDNPCVVLPTGSGKSFVIAEGIRRWTAGYPKFRCIVLAHRQELVSQNAAEFRDLGTGQDVGIFAAGLKRRDIDHSITFAGIDSVYKMGGEFTAFDVIIVDEAHRIPAKGEGKYREFIKMAKLANKNLRVIGFTATPFRMGCGPICHKDHILNHVCYEANVGYLIAQGYLSLLRSKVSAESPDLSDVKRNSGGDYITGSLAKAVGKDGLVDRAVADAIKNLNHEGCKSVVWFCVDVDHCKAVHESLARYGIDAPVVTGNTSQENRKLYIRRFQDRQVQHIINCNIFTEGFNVKHVDGIILLRPTLSKGLYAQMVGRGLRLHPGKTFCLVLDYANCIQEHGPIDCLDAGEVKLEICSRCREVFSRAIRICPNCGWEVPKQEIERREAEESERKMHEERAAQIAILGSIPTEMAVDDVFVDLHKKDGSPDSMRVSYRCGMNMIREWVCLDHQGFAGRKAKMWWGIRFGHEAAKKMTVEKAVNDMLLHNMLKEMTEALIVKKVGKYYEILDHKLRRLYEQASRRNQGDESAR